MLIPGQSWERGFKKMKKSNHWLWAGMIVLLLALLAAGCTNQGGTADSDENNDQVITYKLTLYYPSPIYVDEEVTLSVVAEVESQPAEDGTVVRFNVSDGTITPTSIVTQNGLGTTKLKVSKAGGVVLTAVANKTIVSQDITVIKPDEPVPNP